MNCGAIWPLVILLNLSVYLASPQGQICSHQTLLFVRSCVSESTAERNANMQKNQRNTS